MRKAFRDCDVFVIDDEIVGLSLGSDFCAEHEQGVAKLEEHLGCIPFDVNKHLKKIKEKEIGLEAKRVKSIKALLFDSLVVDDITYYYIALRLPAFFEADTDYEKYFKSLFTRETTLDTHFEEHKILSYWDESGFAVLLKDEAHFEELRDLFLKKKMHFIVHRSANPFSNPSPCFIHESQLQSEEIKNEYMDKQLTAIKTKRIHNELGIEKKFRNKAEEWSKNKDSSGNPWGYFALSPTLIDKEKQIKHNTGYELIYWLNPSNQSHINYGWFTVEQLEDWLEEKDDCIRKSEESWEELKWLSSHGRADYITINYKHFTGYAPEYQPRGSRYDSKKKILKSGPDDNFEKICKQILYLFYDDMRLQVEHKGKSVHNVQPRSEVKERVFGFLEALSWAGIGYFGACNTPADRENFSWLKDVLEDEAWLYLAKEMKYISVEEENKYMKKHI